MAERTGDDWARARALNTVGYGRVWFDPKEARRALTLSIEVGYAIGDDWAVADGLKMMTTAWLVQDDHRALADAIEDLSREAQRLDNGFFAAWCNACTGYSAMRQGDVARSRLEFERSLELCHVVGDPATAGLVVAWIGELDALTGKTGRGRERLEEFIAHASATGGHFGVGPGVLTLATIMLSAGDTHAAYDLVSSLASVFSVPLLASWCFAIQGAASVALERYDEARSCLEHAVESAAGSRQPMARFPHR